MIFVKSHTASFGEGKLNVNDVVDLCVVIVLNCNKYGKCFDRFVRFVCRVLIYITIDSETIRKTISDSLLAWNHNSEIAKKFWVKDIE